MTTTVEYREIVRDWVGSLPDDATVDAMVVTFASDTLPAERAALRILRRRRTDEGQFSTFSVDGDASWNQGEWVKDLDRRIAELRARIGGDEAPTDTLPAATVATITGPGIPR